MAPTLTEPSWAISDRAAELHRDALVWDDHGGWAYDRADDLEELERWQAAGCNYLSINAVFDAQRWTSGVEAFSGYRRWIREHSDEYVQVETVDDVHRAKSEGLLAVSFDVEGMNALNGDVGMVDVFYRLGVRHMLFAYNRNNMAGGGCHEEDTGLTAFGRDVIREMNRVGMVVDCSHTGHRTTMEAMEFSEAPVIFSHSNARALCDHERNITDDQIDACAATGGVVGVTGVGSFLGEGGTIRRLVDHIDYMVDRVGVNHVGFGMDSVLDREQSPTYEEDSRYWPEDIYPPGVDLGFLAPEALPRLTQELLDRGYDERDIRAILGENFLRVATEVWR